MIDRSNCAATQHGTASAYRNQRCRCDDARHAWTTYKKRQAAGVLVPVTVDNIGVVRRRQALAAIGYGLTDLMPYFNTTRRGIGTFATSGRRVHRDTHRRWCQVYDLLSMTPGSSDKARREAARRGWAPPLAWDDIDNPDETPDIGGKAARTAADVAEEARFLQGYRLSDRDIARRLGVSEGWVKQLLGGGKRAAA